jgi:hypothetical protein
MIIVAGLFFVAMGLSISWLPLLLPVKCALLLAYCWVAQRQLKRYVFLTDAQSITDIHFDEQLGWQITQKNKTKQSVRLSPKTVVYAHWMFLLFELNGKDAKEAKAKNCRVVLANDSVTAKEWSLLEMLVRFAPPTK